MLWRSEAGADVFLAQIIDSCNVSVSVVSGVYTEWNTP